ncbi:MAG: hypothetical protein HFE86_03105 [Clostridiales bacterium]|nr:hypothetical protein [Clostridiales bacterium]
MNDISTYWNQAAKVGDAKATAKAATVKKDDGISLDMTDFLKLMIAQFQNQSIDDTADTSEMLNQMVQMQMVQALVNMNDASVMSYAASLVGKEVTIGTYDAEGKLKEIVGTVTGTGTLNGAQVVFVNDEYYTMSEILAVGRLPEPPTPSKPDTDGEGNGEGDSSSKPEPPKEDVEE